jgi:hypothetical protein
MKQEQTQLETAIEKTALYLMIGGKKKAQRQMHKSG